jgi:Carboxypeptidase regulatory-like domain
MTRHIILLTATFLCVVNGAAAQPPVRPASEPSRSVTLSLAEYNRLIDRATQAAPGPIPPPVAAVLSTAELRVRVDGVTARGAFALAGDVLRPGLNTVKLLSGTTVLGASAAGRPLPLVVDGRAHAAILPGPGPFAVDLEWGAPLAFRPGRAQFALPVPAAGTAHATIDVPGDQADVHVSPGWITRRSTANGRTIVEATLDPGASTEVWWSMRDSAPVAAAREVRTAADVMTLLTLGESDVRMIALVDLTVVQGETRSLEVTLPAGYELTGVSGNSLETSEVRDGTIVLTLADPALRRHQFLVTLERAHAGGSFELDTGLVAVQGVQRERGEAAIEGTGTLDLSIAERTGMQRVDVRELNASMRSLARSPLLAGFRYQRTPSIAPGLTLAVARFADAGVLAAAVERAEATTLVTAEGRALTEVKLHVQNRAQPFLRMTLPTGASIASVEVAGQTAKPVLGDDGTRVPLLRPGFRPRGTYEVSYVYLHAGAPFGKKGEIELSLPRMDIPVGVVDWEVFVPGNYSVRHIDGNAISQRVVQRALVREGEQARKDEMARVPTGSVDALQRSGGGQGAGSGTVSARSLGVGGGVAASGRIVVAPAPGDRPGSLRGRVVDAGGTALPGVTVFVTAADGQRSAVTQADGTFLLTGVPPGQLTVSTALAGFMPQTTTFSTSGAAQRVDVVMSIGGLAESITVTGSTPLVDTQVSENIVNLQRRAAGVLPIPFEVPRAGTSHRFARPLVVDDETTVRLRYARR